MKLHFLLVGAVAIGLLTLATDSDAHGGGGGGGGMFHGGDGMFHGGGARGGVAMFRGGGAMFHGGWHSGGMRGRGRFFNHGRFLVRVSAFMAMDTHGGTIGTMGTIPTGTMSIYGSPSDRVQNAQVLSTKAVQTALAWRGYYRGRIDGVMGPETRDAIRSFQAHQSLPVTGQIDHGLLNALRRGGSNDHKTT
jgi:Putative peptidoglycan binding domain